MNRAALDEEEGMTDAMSVDSDDESDDDRIIKKRDRFRTREKTMLGDFVESDDDDEQALSRGGLGSRANKGVNFVGAGQAGTDTSRRIGDESAKRLPDPGRTSFLPKKRQSAAPLASGSVPLGTWAGSGYGLKMLEKFGFDSSAGKGLGTQGQGRVDPIETKLRPQKAGLAYGGFKERQEPVKRQERSESDVERTAVQDREAAWRKATRTSAKKHSRRYPTADEIIASVQGDPDQPHEEEEVRILDMTGAQTKEVKSIAEMMINPTPDESPYIPELRHNVKVIVTTARRELEYLAKDGQIQAQKRVQLSTELDALKVKCEAEVKRLEQERAASALVASILAEIATIASNESDKYVHLMASMSHLTTLYADQVSAHHLSDLVLEAALPYYKIALSRWDPLENPHYLLENLSLLKSSIEPEHVKSNVMTQAILDPFHRADLEIDASAQGSMTAYEDLLYTLWLPRLRSALNNDWDVREPEVAKGLIADWSVILPAFIREQIMDQLILPKLKSALKEWRPELSSAKDEALEWLLPWLHLTSFHHEELIEEIRRKLRSRLSLWRPGLAVPDLGLWAKVPELNTQDLTFKVILPKLARHLGEIIIDPGQQSLSRIDAVMPWAAPLGPKALRKLFEAEFFPKWFQVLYEWLCGDPNYDQVAQWYAWWKSTLQDKLPKEGKWAACFDTAFHKGLEFMDMSMDLGPHRTRDLPVPTVAEKTKTVREKIRPMATTMAPTFREIVEDLLNQEGLFMHKLDQVDLPTGRPIFLITRRGNKAKSNGGGGGGIRIRLSPQDEVIWRETATGWAPVGMTDLIKRMK